MKKNDLILIVIIMLVAGIIFGTWKYTNSNKDRKIITIYIENEIYYTHKLTENLNEKFDIKTDYGFNIVTIENGVVDIIEADCPDKICVDGKVISEVGESLVCLPHQVYIEITGITSDEGVDVISY